VISRDITGEDELDLSNAAVQTLGPLVEDHLPSGDPENPGVYTTQGAVLAMDLGQGFLSMAAGSEGQTLGQGQRGIARGGARIAYAENVTLQSETLPDGTPVTIRLRYRIAFARACLHDLDPAIVASSALQECLSDLEVRASLRNESLVTDSTTHNHFVPVGFGSTVTGLFADPTQVGEASVPAEVGETVRVDVFADAAGHLEIAKHGEALPTGATAGVLVVVFGIESDPPGVEAFSPLLGGTLPGFAGVTASNALAHVLSVDVGAPVVVPEPGALAGALGVLGMLGASARRREAVL
jgi:hypothetical protein